LLTLRARVAFIDAASKHKSALQVANLLKEEKIKAVLVSYASIFHNQEKPSKLLVPITDSLNSHIAKASMKPIWAWISHDLMPEAAKQ